MNDDSQKTVTAETSPEDLVAIARKQFEDDASDEKPIREEAARDLRFEAGSQWDTRIKNERVNAGRPALTFNRSHTFVQQVSNEARQQRLQIKFVVPDGGDQDTADIKEGLARHIQYTSEAQIAYETAVEYAAGGSFGYFGFLTDYVNEQGWDQELKVRAFFDPFAVYGILIPSCFGMEPQHGFVIEELPVAEYKRQYKTEDIDEVGGWEQAARLSEGWIGTDTVRVAEYWYIEHEQKEIKRKNPITKQEETRTIDKKTVKFCKLNGLRIIPGTETVWPGSTIPIIPVLGKQRIVDGKPLLFSVIRFQRDPQQLINAYKTRIAETLMTQPISPFMVPEGAISKENMKAWKMMNTQLTPFLFYKSKVDGMDVPAPTRNVVEAPIQSLSEAAAQEIDDMKATTGIYDASLGNKSNESSGIALQRRQQQSDITNMHFMDNFERAGKKGGLIIAEVMPKIYDSDRIVRILGEDEAPKMARINAKHAINGKQVHYKVGGDDAEKHDVIVTMGRAFSTKRMESFDMMTSVLQAQPDLMGVMGDLFFQNSDMAGSDLMAERMKRFIQISKPGIIPQEGADPEAQVQQLQAQVQQLTQAHQALNAYAQKLEQDRNGKIAATQMQEQTRIATVRMQETTKLAVAQINASKAAQEGIADREIQQYQLLHDSAHDAAMQAAQQAHEKAMAQISHQQALEQGQQTADNAQVLAAQNAAQQQNQPAQ